MDLAICDHFNIVLETLIQKGVAIDEKDIEGYTPLAEAFNRGNLIGAKILRSHGALASFVDERIFDRLRKLSPNSAAEGIYPLESFDWAQIEEARVLAITSRTAVKAHRKGHVTFHELLDVELQTLCLFLEMLGNDNLSRKIDFPLTTFPFKSRMDMLSTLNNWIPYISYPRKQFLKECSALGGRDEETYELLASRKALNRLHGFGLSLTDFKDSPSAKIRLLLSDKARTAYASGFRPSDYKKLAVEQIPSLLTKAVIAKGKDMEDKAAFLTRLSSEQE